MNSAIYWDNFANEATTERDVFAPPERYINIHCGDEEYIEKWFVGKTGLLILTYTVEDFRAGKTWDIRTALAEKNDVRLLYMTDWTVPMEHYKKLQRCVE